MTMQTRFEPIHLSCGCSFARKITMENNIETSRKVVCFGLARNCGKEHTIELDVSTHSKEEI